MLYLQIRDCWPGITPKQINEDFTPEQLRVLMDSENEWRESKEEAQDRAEKQPQRQSRTSDGVQWVSGDTMFNLLCGSGN